MRFTHVIAPALLVLAAACGSSSTGPGPVHVDGTTLAWFAGDTVRLGYTKEFSCTNPPVAHSASGCEIGSPNQTASDTTLPVIWVMVPLYGTPSSAVPLQCPTSGSCIDHPHDLDLNTYLGAVFPAADTIAPLPPHSHIIDDAAGNKNVGWQVKVIGVLNDSTWTSITAAESLTEVRALQTMDGVNAGNPVGAHITADLASNLVLFFEVE